MKFDRNKAFPYPVLRPHSDDYINVDFQTTVDYSVGKEKINAEITYAISSDEIVREISKGRAAYVSIVSCRDTYFQRVLCSQQQVIQAEFSIGDFRGEVRVDSYVVVRNKLVKFSSPDINTEFGPGPFKFDPGEILAQDETQVFYIDRDLFKPVISVFDLVKKEELSDGEWTIDFEEDHVQIEVSPKMKASIDDARNSQKNRIVLLNSIYFSAVTQAVQKLKELPDDCEGKKWAEIIKRQAHNKGCDLDSHDAYLIAERLMRHPFSLLDTYVFKGTN